MGHNNNLGAAQQPAPRRANGCSRVSGLRGFGSPASQAGGARHARPTCRRSDLHPLPTEMPTARGTCALWSAHVLALGKSLRELQPRAARRSAPDGGVHLVGGLERVALKARGLRGLDHHVEVRRHLVPVVVDDTIGRVAVLRLKVALVAESVALPHVVRLALELEDAEGHPDEAAEAVQADVGLLPPLVEGERHPGAAHDRCGQEHDQVAPEVGGHRPRVPLVGVDGEHALGGVHTGAVEGEDELLCVVAAHPEDASEVVGDAPGGSTSLGPVVVDRALQVGDVYRAGPAEARRREEAVEEGGHAAYRRDHQADEEAGGGPQGGRGHEQERDNEEEGHGDAGEADEGPARYTSP
eukprot:CAMPEP_0206002136 /NCGR_PEP_ID=MMETSP1464-20131121/2559_1 /ASSEMBLY_ACC=CAM_ASM_001124 /TAXON_ID=119497 /ORGANISM="Exanthemachrysis gayraliae, Strain RCC1523" /LENGTH=354 /DNA_ID=CAMNT_0053375471 /DNA_START=117 /DNA_END=1179 /DNA_ORIENTATION=+